MFRARRRPSRARFLWLCLALAPVLGSLRLGAFLGSVRVTLPATMSFAVTNVSASTVASPNPTTVSYDTAVLIPGQALRISVKADSDFVPPSGTAIPASNVSWTTSGASQGTGINGVLSKTVYSQLFQGNVLASSGSVNVTWSLAAPGTPLRAGNHNLTMRWKLEAF
jgi:hypothetical protein